MAVNVKVSLAGEASTETLPDAIKVRASAIQGESGGPAIDAAGKAVGVIEAVDPSGAYTTLTPVSDFPGGATQEPSQPAQHRA
jgi:S1-C subfamily serine protease